MLQGLEQYGLRANLDKCEFFNDQISYCGHVIDKDGLHKSDEKTNERAPKPENVSQLRSFLGLVIYYHSFLPNLASVLGPLNELLQNNKKWVWTTKCDDSFAKVKELIISEQVQCSSSYRCITLRDRRCTLACNGGWNRTSYCVCISYFD